MFNYQLASNFQGTLSICTEAQSTVILIEFKLDQLGRKSVLPVLYLIIFTLTYKCLLPHTANFPEYSMDVVGPTHTLQLFLARYLKLPTLMVACSYYVYMPRDRVVMQG